MAGAEEKFFFHMHNFDDNVIDEPPPIEEEVEDLPPPPPVFSEAEVEAAKKQAFADGHAQGVKETEASRAQALATMMQKLAADTQTLFAAEAIREATFEREAVALCRALFERAYPAFQEKYGFDAMIEHLETVLKTQQAQKAIEIRVSEDYLAGVNAFMNKLSSQNPNLSFSVIADDTITSGSFKLGWQDGGAAYDSGAIVDTIMGNLDEILAGERVTSHNDKGDESIPSPDQTMHAEGTDTQIEEKPIAEEENNDE